MKDPAALLYIDSWKVSTTEMSAVARAYYMDLLLHQYDKGSLPNDIEELANICRVRFSEFDQFKQVFEQVLKHKFKQGEDERLRNENASEIIRKRENFKDKRSNSGKLSYIIRFARKKYKGDEKFIEYLKSNLNIDNIDTKNEQVLKQVLKQNFELYINKDGDGDKSKPKNGIPPFEEFKTYALEKKPNIDQFDLKLKYESWIEAGWKTGQGKQIKNWKSTLLNTIPYIKEKQNEQSRPAYKQLR